MKGVVKVDKMENEEKQLETIKSIGERLLKIVDNAVNEKEVPSKEVLDTFKIALSIIAGLS